MKAILSKPLLDTVMIRFAALLPRNALFIISALQLLGVCVF